MVASSAKSKSAVFATEKVGNAAYLDRHNLQMFQDGRSFSGNERDKLFFNRGDGTFADLSDLSACDSPNDGRAVIAFDADDDGDVDLFVHNIQRERHALYRNEIGERYGSFVKLRLKATSSQHEAIGATVIVHGPHGPVAQVLSRGAGFASCQVPELVFGLGAAPAAEVEVRWPGGAVEAFGLVAAGSRWVLIEGEGSPRPIAARERVLPEPLPRGLKLGLGDRVPPLALLSAEGGVEALDVAEAAGDVPLYLNFWASYCAPCVAELPALQALHESGEARVIAISTDAPADSGRAFALFEARGARFPCFFIGARGDERRGLAGLESVIDLERLPIPTTLVLSPGGVVERILRGPLREE
ncbi:MAG: hypothetical protein CMJ84_11600 [Planctomycetes bacterium]|nr:hypothetical protein [Planctomycetota bacterium]